MSNKLYSLLLFLFLSQSFFAEIKNETRTYAVKDGQSLQLDIYKDQSGTNQPCLIFVFGGGFKEGSRDQPLYKSYYHYFAKNGFTVAAIDYRLALKNEKSPSALNVKPLRKAIGIAVEDLFSATDYILKYADELQIDTSRIIISGSSAGAMTVLHADYERRNQMASDTILSPKFQYAGVIAFAGAIFSSKGQPTYRKAPAPTLLFHGNADKMVTYNKISFFNLGLYGSKQIAKRFRDEQYPYLFYTMENVSHDVAIYPLEDFQPEILKFIQDFVFEKKQLMIDINYWNPNQKSRYDMSPKEYYNKENGK